MRISHHATLAIPNWTAFKTEFIRATENDVELRNFVTDLMIKPAKEAKQPSTELGYNVMHAAMARAIAGASFIWRVGAGGPIRKGWQLPCAAAYYRISNPPP